jgi:hypothetical protein
VFRPEHCTRSRRFGASHSGSKHGLGREISMFIIGRDKRDAPRVAHPFPIMVPLAYGHSLVFRVCYLLMGVGSCSTSSCALCLLPAYGYGFVLRANCYGHRYSFVLHACCHTRFASLAHAVTAAPRGPPPLAPRRASSWNICNMKHLLQHTFETDETYTTYACNICV